MVGDILEYDEELTIRITFRLKDHGNLEYKYLQLYMGNGKKPKLYPEEHLGLKMDCEKISENGLELYEYTVTFHPRNIMVINKFGGCSGFFNQIQRIEDSYIREQDTEAEYTDISFESIEFAYDGKQLKGFFA